MFFSAPVQFSSESKTREHSSLVAIYSVEMNRFAYFGTTDIIFNAAEMISLQRRLKGHLKGSFQFKRRRWRDDIELVEQNEELQKGLKNETVIETEVTGT